MKNQTTTETRRFTYSTIPTVLVMLERWVKNGGLKTAARVFKAEVFEMEGQMGELREAVRTGQAFEVTPLRRFFLHQCGM
jgi:hypothetical protein